MWKVGLELTVHDGPETARRETVERNAQLLADLARRAISTNEVLGTDVLGVPSLEILQRCGDRVGKARIFLHLELINGGAAFHENLMAKEVSNVYFLHLALRCDVYPPESRIAKRTGPVEQLHAVAVKNSRVKEWTLL